MNRNDTEAESRQKNSNTKEVPLWLWQLMGLSQPIRIPKPLNSQSGLLPRVFIISTPFPPFYFYFYFYFLYLLFIERTYLIPHFFTVFIFFFLTLSDHKPSLPVCSPSHFLSQQIMKIGVFF